MQLFHGLSTIEYWFFTGRKAFYLFNVLCYNDQFVLMSTLCNIVTEVSKDIIWPEKQKK
jgi:hypothetical protein